MKPPKIWLIVGTRPEVIKMAPVYWALKKHDCKLEVCDTGQAPDLVSNLAKELDVRIETCLEAATEVRAPGGLPELFTCVYENFLQLLRAEAKLPDMIVVQGDTISAMACGLVAFHLGIPLAHVEAGLRTGDMKSPFPEESCRVCLDAISTLCFAPTAGDCVDAKEGSWYISGNTVIDAVGWAGAQASHRVFPGEYVLITLHRREAWDAGLLKICKGIAKAAKNNPDIKFIWPAHPNPIVQGHAMKLAEACDNVQIFEPMGFVEFVRAMKDARLIVTDSGGIQEEACYLLKRVICCRETTERHAGIIRGAVTLVGFVVDKVAGYIEWALDAPPLDPTTRWVYGKGTAGTFIADRIINHLTEGGE